MITRLLFSKYTKAIRLILTLVLSVFFFGSCAVKQTPDLTEEEVYSIINEIVKSDSLILKEVCWKFQTIELTDEMKKEFTKEDLRFIYRQKKLFKNPAIKSGKLKWYHWKKKKFLTTELDTFCKQGIVYHLSFPIISADRKKVIFQIQSDCNCDVGGSGGKDLYEKKNGHWVRTDGFDYWVGQNQISTCYTN